MRRRMRTYGIVALGFIVASSSECALGEAVLAESGGADADATAITVEEQVCSVDGTCNKVLSSATSASASASAISEVETDGDAAAGSPTSFLVKILPPDQQPYCSLYLAESTIPGAGMGIFTVEEKRKGETVSRGDLCIPFIDMYWHNGDSIPVNPFKDYFWMGTSMGMAQETDSDDIEAYCPGLDCAVNTHPALNNLEKMTPIYDEAGLHRSVDPGSGAFTPYHNGSTYVYRDIPAGGELFKDYGYSWFQHRWEIFQHLPMWDHYAEAQEIIAKMARINVQDSVKEDLYAILKGLRRADAPTSSPETSFQSLVLKALPESYQDAKYIAENDKDIPFLHQDKHVQPVEYLRASGKCLDHIQNRRSTIRQAGRGAFAVRDLPAGTVVSASPLHHIEEGFANMYNFTQRRDGTWIRITDHIVGKQLMLNYCYQHPQSTVLFCPYGSGINYINHHRENANVRIQWAQNFTVGHNQSMLEGPLRDLLATPKPKLSFDYVVTKNIKEGEELFIDYGDEWIAAWEKHVATWQPLPNSESYHSARSMNAEFPDSILRTEEEQLADPYPPNLELRCHKGLFNAAGKTSFTWHINDVGLPCRILFRDVYKDQVLYTVELEFTHGQKVTRSQRADVPRQSLAFVDVPGTTDMHQPNVFRHPIGIPDDMYPEDWKNKLYELDGDGAESGPSEPKMTPIEEVSDDSEDDEQGEEDEDDYYY